MAKPAVPVKRPGVVIVVRVRGAGRVISGDARGHAVVARWHRCGGCRLGGQPQRKHNDGDLAR